MTQTPAFGPLTFVQEFTRKAFEEYKQRNLQDGALWRAFKQDFEDWDWDDAIGGSVNENFRVEFRRWLFEHGLWCPATPGRTIIPQMRTLTDSNEYHQWTEEDWDSVKRLGFTFHTMWADPDTRHQAYLARLKEEAHQAKQASNMKEIQDLIDERERNEKGEQDKEEKEREKQNKERKKSKEEDHDEKEKKGEVDGDHESQAGRGGGGGGDDDPGRFANPYPYEPKNPFPKNKQIESLIKIYRESDKYPGPQDSIDDKLRIFWMNVSLASVAPDNHVEALQIMMVGPARETYLEKFMNEEDHEHTDFKARITWMKSVYETDQWRGERELIWHAISMAIVANKHPEWTLSQVFDFVNKECRRVRKGVPSLQGDETLRSKLISACMGVPELSIPLVKPGRTADDVCRQVFSQLAQLNYRDPVSAFVVAEHPNGVMLTERRFNVASSMRPRGGGFSGNGSFRPMNRGGANGGARGGFRSSTNARQKICVVCKKVGCWSTNHPREEAEQAFAALRSKGVTVNRAFLLKFEGDNPAESDTFLIEFEEWEAQEAAADNQYYSNEVSPQSSYLLNDVGGEEQYAQYLAEARDSHIFSAPRE